MKIRNPGFDRLRSPPPGPPIWTFLLPRRVDMEHADDLLPAILHCRVPVLGFSVVTGGCSLVVWMVIGLCLFTCVLEEHTAWQCSGCFRTMREFSVRHRLCVCAGFNSHPTSLDHVTISWPSVLESQTVYPHLLQPGQHVAPWPCCWGRLLSPDSGQRAGSQTMASDNCGGHFTAPKTWTTRRPLFRARTLG